MVDNWLSYCYNVKKKRSKLVNKSTNMNLYLQFKLQLCQTFCFLTLNGNLPTQL